MRRLLGFPDTVNENAVRVVAGGVVLQAIVLLVLRQWWLLIPLTYGFAARVASGPRLSPLGLLATRVVAPRLPAGRQVPGAPKRFAQAIGLTFTSAASIAWALGSPTVALVLVAGLAVAASLEAGAGICLGCLVYDRIWGCPECADISGRLGMTPAVVRVDRRR